MAANQREYWDGEVAMLTVTWTDNSSGQLVDPSPVSLSVEPAGGTATVYNYPGPNITHVTATPANGFYQAFVPVSITNGQSQQRWDYTWLAGSGIDAGVVTGYFVVRKRVV